MGFNGQHTSRVLPSLTAKSDKDDKVSLYYEHIIALQTEAIKVLHARVTALETK